VLNYSEIMPINNTRYLPTFSKQMLNMSSASVVSNLTAKAEDELQYYVLQWFASPNAY